MNLFSVAFVVLTLHAAPFTATITASGHSPKINTNWAYSVKVVDPAGKPLAAAISAVVVDPIGQIHAVRLASHGSTPGKAVTNYPIRGTFSNSVVWPVDARGYPLTFRVTVRAAGVKRTLNYVLTPR